MTKRGAPVKLTRKEFDILYCLMSRAGRVVTYAKLLTAVWGAECREEVEYLRTFVRQLRKKIEDDPSNPDLSAHRCLRRLPLCRCTDVPAEEPGGDGSSLPSWRRRRVVTQPRVLQRHARDAKLVGSGNQTLVSRIPLNVRFNGF